MSGTGNAISTILPAVRTGWTIRVALANLSREDFTAVGGRIAQILGEYHAAWQQESPS